MLSASSPDPSVLSSVVLPVDMLPVDMPEETNVLRPPDIPSPALLWVVDSVVVTPVSCGVLAWEVLP